MNFDKKFEILTDGSDAISVYKYVKDFIVCSIIDTVAVSYFSNFIPRVKVEIKYIFLRYHGVHLPQRKVLKNLGYSLLVKLVVTTPVIFSKISSRENIFP